MLRTCESVTEGHPDKVADFLADSILDAYLAQDPQARVACEAVCKDDKVLLAGEITSHAHVDHDSVVRGAIRQIGYTDSSEPFSVDGVKITTWLSTQAPEIGGAVSQSTDASGEQGAGDQGMMYGYACDERSEMLPLPLVLAHRLASQLASDRRSGAAPWLRPDGKTQVTVRYEGEQPREVTRVVVSAQHLRDTPAAQIEAYARESLAPAALGPWLTTKTELTINPAGGFVLGGPSADAGLTGRKIMVDTYGGLARHGGGAFSGKDPSKVDRSGAYFCRYVARRLVAEGLARRAEVHVAYAIGHARPVAVEVETFGTGDLESAKSFVGARFDFRPGAIIERLDLRRPIYRRTTNYGHFGRADLPWEAE